MPKKTKIIFISVFIIVGLIIFGFYLWINRDQTTNKNGGSPWYQSFNPFGTGGTTTPDETGTDTPDGINQTPGDTNVGSSKFYQITDFAIAGATFLEETRPLSTMATSTGTTPESLTLPTKSQFEQVPSVRFVERTNGHIYKMFLDTKIKEKISNSTIPAIYEAYFDNGGDTVIYRYLSEEKIINSFVATIGAIKGEFLPQNVSTLNTSKDKTKFFYLTENSNGVTGTLATFEGIKKEIVFNHPFTEWLSESDGNQNIYLTTKPSSSVLGSMFILNTTNRTISKIFGGIYGLTTMISPNGSLVLYSYTTNTGPKLGIFNIKEHSTKDLDTYGLAEKCVWSNNNMDIYCAVPNTIVGNQYPDYWYQGLISFDDFFVKIDAINGSKITIANGDDEKPLDGTFLFLDKNENSLFFTNKKDSTLWSLDIR